MSMNLFLWACNSMLYICDPCYSLECVFQGHGWAFVFGVVYTTIYTSWCLPMKGCGLCTHLHS